MIKRTILLLVFGTSIYGCSFHSVTSSKGNKNLYIKQNKDSNTISVFLKDGKDLLTQVAKPDERPYIHPIIAPNGNGVLTQYRPSHHPHQTGIYWGLKLVNGRDYFMKWQSDYWRKVSSNVISKKGTKVKWQTVYNLLDENGNTTLTETSKWSLQQYNDKYLLDLEWKGLANVNIKFGKYYVGGLFIRMPWRAGIQGEVINARGQRDRDAEAQRAIWCDVGMQIEGRDDWGHIAIFDHPDNNGFPIPWRVDSQLGIGPSRQINGDWELKKGETETVRYRIVIYTGKRDDIELNHLWKDFICEVQ